MVEGRGESESTWEWSDLTTDLSGSTSAAVAIVFESDSAVAVPLVEGSLAGTISEVGATSVEVGRTVVGFLRCLKIILARSSIVGL